MKISVNNNQTKNKELVYQEGFWSGKKNITYDGQTLKKIKRGSYEFKNGEGTEVFEVKGNQLIGVKIKMFNKDIEVLRQLAWYELLLSVLVLVPGVFCGLIGGVIGGVLGVLNLFLIRILANGTSKCFLQWVFLQQKLC